MGGALSLQGFENRTSSHLLRSLLLSPSPPFTYPSGYTLPINIAGELPVPF